MPILMYGAKPRHGTSNTEDAKAVSLHTGQTEICHNHISNSIIWTLPTNQTQIPRYIFLEGLTYSTVHPIYKKGVLLPPVTEFCIFGQQINILNFEVRHPRCVLNHNVENECENQS
jgi:hypothetical protein